VLVATALAFAAALVARRGATTFLLAAWLALLAELQVVPLALSPVHAVGRPGYAAVELALLTIALLLWSFAGRPVPRAPDFAFARAQPALLVLAAGVGVFLVYELLLCLTVPPNNWDSLTYHLARAAAWYRHGGVHWIANAPTERQNAFPAGAELAVLWSFVAARSDRLAALPQFLAQLSAIVATYGISIRVGFNRQAALYSALLVPTLALVALESTTTQNDLIVASLVAAAAYLVLASAASNGTERESALAGVALALALGTKLTAALALPGILVLAVAARLGRRRGVCLLVAFAVTFVAVDSWLYVENIVHTGHPLGEGGGRVEHSPALTAAGWIATVIRVLYRFMDLTGAPWHDPGSITAVAVLALLLPVIAVAWRRPHFLRGASTAIAIAIAAALPLLVTVAAAGARFALTRLDIPIAPSGTSEGPFTWSVSHRAHEDFAYFGALGLLLLAVVAGALRPRNIRARRSRAALAAGFVLFLAGVASFYRFNDFVGRFMLVAVVPAAALLGSVYRWRSVAAGVAGLAVITLALTSVRNELKPARDAPWSLSRAEVLDLQAWQAGIGGGVDALERVVPATACIDALLGGDDAAYPLFGPHLQRRIRYVGTPTPATTVSPREAAVIAGPGEQAVAFGPGWRVTSLAGYWRLAVRTTVARPFACHAGG
jgi:4-amino-4-deoxy-L-arabinose transferase-like glycosyltransferase